MTRLFNVDESHDEQTSRMSCSRDDRLCSCHAHGLSVSELLPAGRRVGTGCVGVGLLGVRSQQKATDRPLDVKGERLETTSTASLGFGAASHRVSLGDVICGTVRRIESPETSNAAPLGNWRGGRP